MLLAAAAGGCCYSSQAVARAGAGGPDRPCDRRLRQGWRSGAFFMPGQFLSPDDPEFELAKDARQVCKTGGLPFLLSVAGTAQCAGRHTVFGSCLRQRARDRDAVRHHPAALTILVPPLKALPIGYLWSVRRRPLYWYGQLKTLERSLDGSMTYEGPSISSANASPNARPACGRRSRARIAWSASIRTRSNADGRANAREDWPGGRGGHLFCRPSDRPIPNTPSSGRRPDGNCPMACHTRTP